LSLPGNAGAPGRLQPSNRRRGKPAIQEGKKVDHQATSARNSQRFAKERNSK
jgi:hypothetical protein